MYYYVFYYIDNQSDIYFDHQMNLGTKLAFLLKRKFINTLLTKTLVVETIHYCMSDPVSHT
jgi:hypothetical protein